MLSDKIKKNLESRKMSVYRLGKLTGIPNSTLRSIVSGDSQSTSYDKLVKIATALDIPVSELTEEKESPLEGCYIEVAKIAQDKKIDPDRLKALIELISKDS